MVKVKICGITRPEDAEFAVRMGADYVGVILYPKSPRFVLPEDRKEILRASEGAVKVAVFVNPTLEEVFSAFEEGFDLVQLHGEEEPGFAYKCGIERVIKAFRVGKKPPDIEEVWKEAHGVLLDTYSEKAYGGTGKVFNWELAKAVARKGFRLFLSGGLKTENVKEAVLKVRPYAVDVSSGVELELGVKDKIKVESFIKEAKSL
ncbi:phosphoribosylanthranilate isomerase [Hydrogenivirga caldilitoris]|uniref:N-(5'-phosphoribosyl)anthranilate isomerase n=1 Tax=Hydrogenivirga caldilitoris TaxID=246264 RepID=A0A497XTP3_9AQUI|nr:phosphoribosylanthranilate isomerase [Hydrogenivirga caldilitoris]RLJ70293.1 phosphoribosylanthranilate isomerase [Hydrogenivirga caldilitoris]